MIVEAPSSLIYGRDNFVAKKLGELLISRGINVFWDNEIVSKPLYYFDFGGGEERDREMMEKKVKICKIHNNHELRITNYEWNKNIDIRQVNLYGVYGIGMDKNWWFARAVGLAARNKNLVLPKYGEKFRLLAVEDAVEAIMRAVIISGTNGKTFGVAGDEIESKIVASALIDLAKMTKIEVRERDEERGMSNEEEGNYIASAKMLRWKPMTEFRDGVKEVVAEAVARVDEEQRNEHRGLGVEVKGERMLIRAEIEEAGEKEGIKIKEKEVIIEEDEVEEEEKTVGKKMVWNKIEPNLFKEKEIVREIIEEKKEKVEIKKPEIKILPPTVLQSRRAGFPWKWVGMGVVVLMMGLVYGWFLWEALGVTMNLEQPIKMLEQEQIKEATTMVTKLQLQNKRVKQFWRNTKFGEIVNISGEVLEIETKLIAIVDSMDKINEAVFEEKTIDFNRELINVSKNLEEVEIGIGVVQARLVGVRKWIPGKWRLEIDKESEIISKNTELVSKLRQLIRVLPEVLGLDGKRRDYLVLLQNEMELRATGGFIGSYGVLSFEAGRILSFDVKDVYEADGQLRGHVEPPEEIKRYLGEAGWFMRDANWKASFTESAKDIQWFFEKEMGRKVDGVIGVDLAVVKAMLNATGSIFVPDFKEEVNKDNLFEQAEFYSESKFFPGSVQKASFLGGMGKQLFEEISRLKTLQRWKLMVGLIDSLERNDLQVALNDPVAAAVMTDLGWSGDIFAGNCGIKDCYTDYLYIVESNLGVNKANYFLYRNIEQRVDLRGERVERILRINYENMAKNTSWPGGDYKNYLRIYLPKDVQVSEVTIILGGQIQNVPLNEVKMTNVGEKREIGFLVTVPILKKMVVEVKYNSKFAQMMDKFSYLLYIQRQPGFGDTGMVNLVSLPSGYQPMQVTPAASVVSGKLLFNQKLDRDIKMGVEISK